MASNIEPYKHYRFIKQRDTFSCGPVAMINLYKWAGFPFTYKDVKPMQKVLGTGKPSGVTGLCGTFSHVIEKELENCDLIDYKRYYYGSSPGAYKKMEKHLDDGGCCIINVYWNNGGGHYFLVIAHTKNKYVTVNYAEGRNTVMFVDKKQLQKYMKNSNWDAEGWHPSCIFEISRK